MKNNYDIKDDELRVIGKPVAAGNSSSGKAGKGYLWIVVAIVVIVTTTINSIVGVVRLLIYP